MRALFMGVAGLGVGGAALFGMDNPDFDRTINRSPTAVYEAFAGLSESGTIALPMEEGDTKQVSIRTTKAPGEGLTYEILVENRPVLTAQLDFAPAGDNGAATRVTAELDVDVTAADPSFQTSEGAAVSMLTESYFDLAFAEMMKELSDKIEAGEVLPPLSAASLGIRRRGDSTNVEVRRYEASRAQREAVRPMTDARPMVDPNQSAREYMNGR